MQRELQVRRVYGDGLSSRKIIYPSSRRVIYPHHGYLHLLRSMEVGMEVGKILGELRRLLLEVSVCLSVCQQWRRCTPTPTRSCYDDAILR